MLAKKIESVDFDGNIRKETYYFNLTAAELTKMEYSKNGGYSTFIKRISEVQDESEVIEQFSKIIDMAYGVKSDDGKYFRKSEEALADFKATNAYSNLFMELLSDMNSAQNFFRNIVPKEVLDAEQVKSSGLTVVSKE